MNKALTLSERIFFRTRCNTDLILILLLFALLPVNNTRSGSNVTGDIRQRRSLDVLARLQEFGSVIST